MRIACAHYDNVAGETAVIVVTAATPFLEKAKSHRCVEVPDATHSDLGKMRKNALTLLSPIVTLYQAWRKHLTLQPLQRISWRIAL